LKASLYKHNNINVTFIYITSEETTSYTVDQLFIKQPELASFNCNSTMLKNHVVKKQKLR